MSRAEKHKLFVDFPSDFCYNVGKSVELGETMKTFGRVLLGVLSLILAVLLLGVTFAAAGIYTVRHTYTEAFIVDTVNDLDFASVRFPDGYGGFTTAAEQINEALDGTGIAFDENTFDQMVRDLSVDKVLRDYLLAFRAWLFEYGPTPQIDLYQMADMILSGMDESLVSFLSYFTDPRNLIAGSLANFLDSSRMDYRLNTLEPLRRVLSGDTLRLLCSFALGLCLLLLLTRRLKLLPSLVISGLSFTGAGVLLYLAPTLFAPYKNSLLGSLAMPEATFDIAYLPLAENFTRYGGMLLMAGLALTLVSLLLLVIATTIRHALRGRNSVQQVEPADFSESDTDAE